MLFAERELLSGADIQLTRPATSERDNKPPAPFIIPPDGLDWPEHEKSILLQALERSGGNQSKSARLLAISRDAFVYRAARFGLI
jgi:DNA-binding NtrC family response regulator